MELSSRSRSSRRTFSSVKAGTRRVDHFRPDLISVLSSTEETSNDAVVSPIIIYRVLARHTKLGGGGPPRFTSQNEMPATLWDRHVNKHSSWPQQCAFYFAIYCAFVSVLFALTDSITKHDDKWEAS